MTPANLNELVRYVSEQTGVSQKKTAHLVAAVLQGIVQLTEAAGALTIRDFGRFEVRQQRARFHNNPLGGPAKKLPAKSSIGFKVSKRLVKDIV